MLGLKVSFPNSSTYLATEGAYWSLQEAELSPTCIVVPSTAEDVSTTVSTIAGNEGCPFAIKGAGHAPQAGSANIVSYVFGTTTSEHELLVNGQGALSLDIVLQLKLLSVMRTSDSGNV